MRTMNHGAGEAASAHEEAKAQSGRATVRFSVVVPLYNKQAYIASALRSVLEQTLDDFEVLVVDDGSTDGGPAIVESFGDPRVRLIRQQNAGVSVARNTGIRHARGEWVVFLDADDWQHPEYLAELRTVQLSHPRVDCVASRYVEFADNGGAPPERWEVLGGLPTVELVHDLAGRWMRGATFFTGSIAVRRSLLQRMQPCFRPGENYGEDLEAWFRISEHTPIALLHVPLVAYRVAVQDSLTARYAKGGLPPWTLRLVERVSDPGFDHKRRRTALALVSHFRLGLARDALVAGRRGMALALLLQARHAASSRRFWFTALLALSPRSVLATYQHRHAPPRAPAPTAQGCAPALQPS